jgi:aspartate racemase
VKTIGLIGGLSWHSTVEYYRVINELVHKRLGGHTSAQITLQSLDFAKVRAYQQAGDWSASGRLLAEAGRRCQDGGADLVLICSNLMHKNADDVAAALDVPLLHIVTAIADRARADGWSRVALLGTRWVMEEQFYIGRLRSLGLDVHVPNAEDRAMIDRVIFNELTHGRVNPASRAAYAQTIAALAAAGAQAIILGCTEIELLVRREDCAVAVLDSMRVHAEAAVDNALAAPLPAAHVA